jgi:hypothetical protein
MPTLIALILIVLVIWLYRKFPQPESPLDKEYLKYINNLGDKNFFCYNNKVSSKEIVEENIVPYLPEQIEIIYLNGKTPESEYPEVVISKMLYGLKSYDGFPHLIKIRGGHITEKSINNEVYNCINQNKDFNTVLFEIYVFFDLHK